MKEPIRVLHVVTYMGRGGLETMLMNYYRQIDRSKIQFDFLVHREFEADYDREILSLGGKIFRLPQLNPFSKTYFKQLNDFFSEHKEYKIVHSHLDCMAGIPLKAAMKQDVPIRIAHAHSSSQTKDKKYLLKLIFKRQITKYATNLFACGDLAGLWMFNSTNFEVLNNAIDTKKYLYNLQIKMRVRDILKINEDTVVVGHVGRFEEPKNHKFLLRIFSEIQKLESNAVLLLVGDGKLRGEIENLARDLDLDDKIIFTGVRSDVNELLQAMDVFVFPSIYEGLPVSLIEAQAAGLPCLISDRVPFECKKTDLVYQMELAENVEIWAKKVMELSRVERKNTYEDIKKSGFDIMENARWLQEYYLNAIK